MITMAIRIHSLPEQRDIARAFGDAVAHFTKYLLHRMVDLAAANVRHDAVRTGIVTTPHDCDEGRNLIVDGWSGVLEFLIRLAPIEKPLRHGFEIFDRLRAHDEIHKWKAILEVFLRAFRCTARHHDLPAGTLRFPALQPADF